MSEERPPADLIHLQRAVDDANRATARAAEGDDNDAFLEAVRAEAAAVHALHEHDWIQVGAPDRLKRIRLLRDAARATPTAS